MTDYVPGLGSLLVLIVAALIAAVFKAADNESYLGDPNGCPKCGASTEDNAYCTYCGKEENCKYD